MKVLCIGHASYDISLPVEEYPTENKKYRVNKKIECGGGPAANAAYLISKWGVETYYQGMVGKDSFGKKIIEEFKSVNVNTDYIEVNDKEDTTISFILINEKSGSRTLFNYAKERPEILHKEYDFIPDIIHVDGHYYEASKKAFNEFPNAIKVIDAGRTSKEVLDLCTMVDYLVCSKEFAENITNIKIDFNDLNSLENVFNKLEEMYNCTIVVTLESFGCMYKESGILKVEKGLKVEAKDTTGAGDIFHGAFVYALSQNLPLSKCVRIANITGGLSVTNIGSKYSMPSKEEVLNYEKNN